MVHKCIVIYPDGREYPESRDLLESAEEQRFQRDRTASDTSRMTSMECYNMRVFTIISLSIDSSIYLIKHSTIDTYSYSSIYSYSSVSFTQRQLHIFYHIHLLPFSHPRCSISGFTRTQFHSLFHSLTFIHIL